MERLPHTVRIPDVVDTVLDRIKDDKAIFGEHKYRTVRRIVNEEIENIVNMNIDYISKYDDSVKLLYTTSQLTQVDKTVKLECKVSEGTKEDIGTIDESAITLSEICRQCMLKHIHDEYRNVDKNTEEVSNLWESVKKQYNIGKALYDESGYVYTIVLIDEHGDDWFYIGMVDQGSSLRKRLGQHIRRKGDFSKEYLGVQFAEVRPYTIDSYDLSSVDDTYAFLREKERETSYRVAIEENTTNVLGGR